MTIQHIYIGKHTFKTVDCVAASMIDHFQRKPTLKIHYVIPRLKMKSRVRVYVSILFVAVLVALLRAGEAVLW